MTLDQQKLEEIVTLVYRRYPHWNGSSNPIL